MKVVHINCVYPYGSTGKITSEIHQALLKQGHESLVIYGRGKRYNDGNAIRICSELKGKFNHFLTRFTGLIYGGCVLETNRLIRILEKEQPDIVHIQCINGYFVNIYRLIDYLKTHPMKTFITLHAEFMYTANCGCTFGCEKWMTGCGECPDYHKVTESYVGDKTSKSFEMMKTAFEGFEKNVRIIGVSNWLSKRAALSPIMKKLDIRTINNGINIQCFSVRDGSRIREELGMIRGEKMVLWVTSAYTDEKGKDYFEQLVRMSCKKNWRFVVVGTEKLEWHNEKVICYGKVSDQNILAEVYSAADVVISLSKQESYPTVLLEAQCCGTSVVGFDVGGVKEAIHQDMGDTVPLGDCSALMESIEKWSIRKYEITGETIEEVRRYFTVDRMIEEYRKCYEN